MNPRLKFIKNKTKVKDLPIIKQYTPIYNSHDINKLSAFIDQDDNVYVSYKKDILKPLNIKYSTKIIDNTRTTLVRKFTEYISEYNSIKIGDKVRIKAAFDNNIGDTLRYVNSSTSTDISRFKGNYEVITCDFTNEINDSNLNINKVKKYTLRGIRDMYFYDEQLEKI